MRKFSGIGCSILVCLTLWFYRAPLLTSPHWFSDLDAVTATIEGYGLWGPAKTGVVRIAPETGAPIILLGLYAAPQWLTSFNYNWGGNRRSGAWQFTGKSYMYFGPAWSPNAQANIHAQAEELMDRIYSLVDEAERDSLCVSPTLLNPILP